jgi:hypothetical protein
VLSALLAVFIVRVLAQALIGAGYGSFLPPWEEWFSGVVPYPQLLASQIVIVIGYGKVCLDFNRQRGFCVAPRRWLGTLLLSAGSVYLAVMVIRYAIRMSLYPLERWTGGSIPIFFHWVLAAFVLVLGLYHRRWSTPAGRRPRALRAMHAAGWLVIVAGLLLWASYQLAPTILAMKRQPWYDGRLGMWGGSAFGYTQWAIWRGVQRVGWNPPPLVPARGRTGVGCADGNHHRSGADQHGLSKRPSAQTGDCGQQLSQVRSQSEHRRGECRRADGRGGDPGPAPRSGGAVTLGAAGCPRGR